MGSKANKQTQVIIHAGVGTIGGTIIEVRYDQARIFFDFGMVYLPELEDLALERQALVDQGLIPALDLYRGTSLNPDFEETAVFVSHVHLDHTHLLNELNPAIPVYMFQESKDLLEALQATEAFLPPLSADQPHSLRPIQGVSKDGKVLVGDIEVDFYPVDHDAYGASAFKITTPDASLAYSGDLRLHGYAPEDTRFFCQAVRGCNLLFLEGVGVSFDREEEEPVTPSPQSERELIAKWIQIIDNNSERAITFNGYPANLLRLAHLIRSSPRPVVVDGPTAYRLQEVLGLQVHYYLTEDSLQETWVHDLDSGLALSQEKLRLQPTAYLWQVTANYDQIPEGGLYIHSNAVPLGDFDPDYQPFLDDLAARGVEFMSLSNSGHAYPEELVQIIDWIQPQVLAPIHTLRPERLKNPYGQRLLPHNGQVLSFPLVNNEGVIIDDE